MWQRIILVVVGAMLAGGCPAFVRAQQTMWINVEGAIGPATADYIARATREASERQAECLIIRLDTPGGLLDSTQVIVRTLLGSRVPTVVYVAPEGAGATSAGTFITLAAHVAAMAPATTIGAAHPVLGGGGELDETTKQKLVNYSASYIESIAQQRKRNVEWARSAVRESASITAEKALELQVIEIIATDRQDLLAQLDGRRIDGRVLQPTGGQIVELPMSFRERLFQLIWRPEVMFILMLVALYGIVGEVSNPGAIIPGVVGVIALILLLYMSSVLPVNWAGVALIGLAVVLFVLELFTPAFGLLTAGAIVAFILGGLMAFDHPGQAFRLSLVLVLPAALLTAAFFLFVVGAGLRAQLRPAKSGQPTMLGRQATARTRIDPKGGKVFIDGELWNATSEAPIDQGQPVRIVGASGLTLKVQPAAQA